MSEYLSFAVPLARKAGKLIKRNFSLGMKKEWKEINSPVTVTDVAIEKMVRKELLKKFPSHGFLGEEGSKTPDKEFMWICDPVDGTMPFSHGIPTCVFMLALTQNGRPIASIIYDPFQDRMFTASKNKGAFLNGKRIYVSNHATLKSAVFAVLFWKQYTKVGIKIYHDMINKDGIDGTIGSIGYVDMLVACGEFSAVVFMGPSPWDSAAPDLLVTEAGGKFTDLYGEVIDYRKKVRGHVATNGILHQKVLDLVKKNKK